MLAVSFLKCLHWQGFRLQCRAQFHLNWVIKQANKIKKVLTRLIDSSQTGFIKGRLIRENIQLLFDIIEYTEEHDIPGMLHFTDFKKAFDSIYHEYITEILNLFNFGQDLKSWTNLFYHSVTSCVLYNGFTIDYFPIDRGVRQGCPLSPYIIIIYIRFRNSFNCYKK